MSLGLLADLIVCGFIIITVVVCTVRGFLHSILRYTSSIIAIFVACWTANPIANFCDAQWHWINAITNWNIPLVAPATLLKIAVGIIMFLIVRFVLILLDLVLNKLREKVRLMNLTDRFCGFWLGVVLAVVELAGIFMLLDTLNLVGLMQLTPESGGFVAHHLFSCCKTYLFPIMQQILNFLVKSFPKF